VPSLLFGPRGGSVADRVDLRRLLIGTQTAYGVLAGVLWALAVAGKASVAVIVAISVASGVVAIVGTTTCFAVNALSYLAVIAALVMLRPLRPGTRARRAAGGVREGLRYAASRQQLWLPRPPGRRTSPSHA
jgi:nitrate/nitrite transporter NarK